MTRARPEVVVITGGTAGVGRATARRFARDGARVAVLARGRDGLEATARDIEARGGLALAIACDVAKPEQVEDAASRIEAELGPIDVWINSAMTTVFGRVDQLSAKEHRRVTDVTYHGVVWGTRAALERMRPRGRGVIVQVGSALSHRAIPLQAAYCAAKHAVRGFTDALRSELLHDGLDIHLTMVQLPAVNTPQFRQCENKLPRAPQPVPPIFQPELAAAIIHWAAHHRRREVYVGLPTIEAILGQQWIPGLLDHYLVHRAYDGQQTDAPAREGASNLFAPLPGDPGVHGDFDDRARQDGAIAAAGSRLGAAGVRALAVGAALALVALVQAARSRRAA
jgi:NAD(P)-dependent dehydrogenase (short-subunit alcohol dehydrogenase family)